MLWLLYIKKLISYRVIKIYHSLVNKYYINNSITIKDNECFFVKINPKEITHIYTVDEGGSLYRNKITGMARGAWDKAIVEINLNPQFASAKHILNNEDKYKNLSLSNNFFYFSIQKIKRLLKLLKNNGWKTQSELNRVCDYWVINNIKIPKNELIIGMDRNGKFFRITGGKHRLIASRILVLKEIYAVLIVWHENAEHKLPIKRRLIDRWPDSFLPID